MVIFNSCQTRSFRKPNNDTITHERWHRGLIWARWVRTCTATLLSRFHKQNWDQKTMLISRPIKQEVILEYTVHVSFSVDDLNKLDVYLQEWTKGSSRVQLQMQSSQAWWGYIPPHSPSYTIWSVHNLKLTPVVSVIENALFREKYHVIVGLHGRLSYFLFWKLEHQAQMFLKYSHDGVNLPCNLPGNFAFFFCTI